jgi:predicted nucleic acid-binding protein
MTSWRPASAGEVERGAYGLQPFPPNDVRRARAVIQRHGDLGVSLADASIVLLAERSGARDVLTLDERHFRTLMAGEEPFRLLPADA